MGIKVNGKRIFVFFSYIKYNEIKELLGKSIYSIKMKPFYIPFLPEL